LVDIHSHILPGIDDGPSDMDMAIKMIRLAWENGTKSIIATPHFIYREKGYEISRQDIKNSCLELTEYVRKEGIEIDIHPGSEVFITPYLPELIDKNLIYTLNNSSYTGCHIKTYSKGIHPCTCTPRKKPGDNRKSGYY
jgi:protein-tyrosine phosphatase